MACQKRNDNTSNQAAPDTSRCRRAADASKSCQSDRAFLLAGKTQPLLVDAGLIRVVVHC